MSAAAHAVSPVLEALRRPDAYPECPRRVEERHSHISWVFLVDDLVYKVKKPVRLSFVDYSTLERRRHFCHEEVRLNRRLAPRVYLGVSPIVRRDARLVVEAVDDAPAAAPAAEEYAVRMRRLPDDRMLDRRLEREGAAAVPVAALARRLSDFHRLCSHGDGERLGSAEAIRRMVVDNLRETDVFVGDTLRRADRERIERDALTFVEERRALLEHRAALGFVREGHGDLRPEHVCLLPDEIVVFDCLEFDQRLRTGDLASEIAFLTMEIDFLGFPDLSEDLARVYAACAEDTDLEWLLPFYAAYRAHVRGKVETLKSRDTELPAARRASARENAKRYFRLAARYTRGPLPPAVVAVLGLSGSGKSTVARLASELSGFVVYSSDVLRKEIARGAQRAEAEDLYSPALTRRIYEALRERAARRLAAGRGVIVDATFQHEAERRALAELAARAGVELVFIECRAREGEIRRRLDERTARGDSVSDATWKVYLSQRDRFAPFVPMAGSRHVAVDTTSGIDVETLERALFG